MKYFRKLESLCDYMFLLIPGIDWNAFNFIQVIPTLFLRFLETKYIIEEFILILTRNYFLLVGLGSLVFV